MAVRFLDNFSSGARGAALCEYLSKEGYCVVSLRRTGSKLPFVRKCEKLFTKKEKNVHNEHVDFLSMFSNNSNNKETKDGEENEECELRQAQGLALLLPLTRPLGMPGRNQGEPMAPNGIGGA